MSYSRSPPLSPQDDWLSRGHSKTFSTNSSRSMSHASRSQSLASASNRVFSSAQYEGNARTYYIELKSYLRDLLAQEAIDGPHPHRVAARQKLSKLSNLQFHELAMDVYDEVVRRNKNDKFLPFLPVKEEFHPKRNQARQKLATLPGSRFKDLASDVYSELVRRYPNFTEQDGGYSTPPIPQMPNNSSIYGNNSKDNKTQPLPSKSTNIIPVKGTMNVETITDDDVLSDVNSPTLSSRSPISPLKEPKDYFNRSSPSENIKNMNNGVDIEKIKSDYEYQINTMSTRIKQLQEEVEGYKHQKATNPKDRDLIETLKKKEKDDQNAIGDMEERYRKLNEKYEDLNREYTLQQEAVRSVKNETRQLLDELKNLAKVNEELLAEKERAENEIERLREEVKDWQKKHDRVRIEIRNFKASSIIESDPNNNLIKENFLQPTRNGIIPQDCIFTYQAYVDELLKAARTNDPPQVIQIMKNIVTVCRSITEEIEKNENSLTLDTKNSLYNMKTRFTSSLSDLLVAAKRHASGMGLSPISLLDRSAGHLTFVVVELAKLLGMNTNVVTDTKKSNISMSSLNDDYYKKSDNFSYYGSSLLNRTLSNNHKNNTSLSRTLSNNQKGDKSLNRQLSNNYKNSVNDNDSISARSGIDSYGYKNTVQDNSSYYSKNSFQRKEQQNSLSPSELVRYLKKETDRIVETIQDLLAALRLPQQNGEAYNIISSLLKVVTTISELSRATCDGPKGYFYQSECDPILSQLGKCSQRIGSIQETYFGKGASATASCKRDLAKEAYEIAKFTKELINLFES